MEWKRKKQEDGSFVHIANEFDYHFRFIIEGLGGHITVRRYFLEVYGGHHKSPSMTLLFFNLKSAKQFAEDINNEKPVLIESIRLGDCYN